MMDHILCIHSSADIHLGCFHLLATVKTVAVNMYIQIPLQDSAFISLRYIPRSGIAGSHGSATFKFFCGIPIMFFIGPALFYMILPTVHKGSNFSTSVPTLIFCFLIVAILIGMRWYLIVVLICIF